MNKNILNIVQAKNKTNLNGFDLSYKHAYSSKLGEILPIFVRSVYPRDKFRINIQDFTRTLPADSSAYARLRKSIQFYFVPYHDIWRFWDTFVTDVRLRHSASSISDVGDVFTRQFPCTTIKQVLQYLNKCAGKYAQHDGEQVVEQQILDELGYFKFEKICKLLQYLGYGDYKALLESWKKPFKAGDTLYDIDSIPNTNKPFNPSKLLAYQKIYNDFFRFDQWQVANPSTFNIDYCVPASDGTTSLDISPLINSGLGYYDTMFDLRYHSYSKDLFKGVLPSAQYGSPSTVTVETSFNGPKTFGFSGMYFRTPGVVSDSYQDVTLRHLNNSNSALHAEPNNQNSAFDIRSGYLDLENYPNPAQGNPFDSQFTVLALRRATALQRRKEISQSNKYTYGDQIEAHWGTKPSDDISHVSRYVGGFNYDISFDEVINTNLANGNSANIKGKGIGSSSGSFDFESRDYGILIGVQVEMPLLDYPNIGGDYLNNFVYPEDLPIPEFDQIGMESVPFDRYGTFLPINENGQVSTKLYPSNPSYIRSFGYAPRYYNEKTEYDKVSGAFLTSLQNWVLMEKPSNLLFHFSPSIGSGIDYANFFIQPSLLDDIFGVKADSSPDTDQFLSNTFISVKALRPFDVNGLPY